MTSPATTRVPWTRRQTLAALHVYFQLPFGQLHQGTPKIKQVAEWIGRTPGAVALKLVNFASLDPVIIASGRKGMGNASALDREIWHDLQENWDGGALDAAAEYERLAAQHGIKADRDLIDDDGALNDAPTFEDGKTRAAVVQVRVNQARFRKAVLSSYNATCCISGLQHEMLVIASHIVPWSQDTQNRLNPQNGLCLSALHDRAYDQGLLTVMPDFTVRVSPRLKSSDEHSYMAESLGRFDGQPIRFPDRFGPAPAFLEWHARHFGFMT
jgi:putative restriction endonuclease